MDFQKLPLTEGDLNIWLKSDFLREGIKRHNKCETIFPSIKLPSTTEHYATERVYGLDKVRLPNTVEEYQELILQCKDEMRKEDYKIITWFYEHAVVVSV